MDNQEIFSNLPANVRAAINDQDASAFQCALDELPEEQAQQIVDELRSAGIISAGLFSERDFQEVLQEFDLLIKAIVAVAQGDHSFQEQVQDVLPTLDSAGYHLGDAVQRLWAGEREVLILTRGLDPNSARLVEHILLLIEGKTPLASIDPDTIVASIPADVLAAIENQDDQAYEQAVSQLSPADQVFVSAQLAKLQAYEDAESPDISTENPYQDFLSELEPMLQAICTVAQGDSRPKPQVEDFLTTLEDQGWRLTGPVQRIWDGERELKALTAGLEANEDTETVNFTAQEIAILSRILEILSQDTNDPLHSF
jgi:hypothetical protein